LKYLFNYLACELLIFSACYAVRHTALTASACLNFYVAKQLLMLFLIIINGCCDNTEHH
jgi:hypothetical protein